VNNALRVGVLGVGSLGFHHARILKEIPGANLIGIHDSDPARLERVSAELGIPAFPIIDDLLTRIEAAVVAVPTTAHERVATVAISHGVSVLVEKPIAPDLAAADRMLAAADQAGVMIQIGHVERFNGALRACEPYLDQPIFVESHRLAPFGPRGTDVAVVLDLMIHDLDLVLALMKRPVTALSAVGVPVLTSSPDIANARLEFEGGGVANLTASRVSLERMRKIRFFQRSGYISLDLAAGTGEFLRIRPGVSLEQRLAALGEGKTLDLVTLMDIVERVSLKSDGVEPLRAELESFVAAAQGREPIAVTGREGRDALAVALQIIKRIEAYVAAAPA